MTKYYNFIQKNAFEMTMGDNFSYYIGTTKRGFNMSYFNYHSTVKKKILQSQKVQMSIVDKYKDITPCLVIQTDFACYPIRTHRWQEYFELATKLDIRIEDNRK